MIDPLVSLAYNVYSSKGMYALLLGSGVSRAAGIPTGWEVVLDLIRNVAKLEGADSGPNPEVWLKDKHGLDPDYSALLDLLAKTPAERQQLLSGYFEPTEEQRKEGLKVPTVAHRAIAWLAAQGYVRVIITTNFDRLIERALEQAGVTPTVISTVDHIKGARPLVHSHVTVVKVHGDYLDSRIRNTDAELVSYEPELNALLDRVLDEYGLIVCGWSAVWDRALRAAIERCPSRRYTMYWATRGEPASVAKTLVAARAGVTIAAADADSFFTQVKEKVESLASIEAQHPLSAKIAVATLKRFIVDNAARIRLRDLIHEDTERLAHKLTAAAFPANQQLAPADVLGRMAQYESHCENLAAMLAAGCYWGDNEQAKLWAQCLQRIASLQEDDGGYPDLVKLRHYPALLLLYASGLGAIANGNYSTLRCFANMVRVAYRGEIKHLFVALNHTTVMSSEFGKNLPGYAKAPTPLSSRLCEKLRDPLREFLPATSEYENAFDRWEYFVGSVHADTVRNEFNDSWWGPWGAFIWRSRFAARDQTAVVVKRELETEGDNWAPLKAGFFGGSKEQAATAFDKYNRHLALLAMQMGI